MMKRLAELLAILVWAVPAWGQPPVTVEYYHLDGVGSVRAVTNGSGAVVRRHDYFPFGEGDGTTAGADPVRFTAKERDAETGLDYFGARYYASRAGRFTTVDPGHVGGNIFDPQSWNAYAYARNNPLRFIDPTGTAYRINIKDGESFWVEDDDDLPHYKQGGFVFKNGVIYNAAGEEVGSYHHYSDFDWMLIDAGRRAEPGVNLAVGALATFGAVVAPVPMSIAGCVAAGADCGAAGTAMAVLPGGPLRIVFKTAHYASRLQAVGLSVRKVETAVDQAVRSLRPVGEVSGRMKVDGVLIQWRAFLLPNGTVNIGSIHPVW